MAIIYTARLLSTGAKGKAQVQVRLPSGGCVTRHLVNGKGLHPDASIPRRHKDLEAARDLLKRRLEVVGAGIKEAESIIQSKTATREDLFKAVSALPRLRAAMLVTPLSLQQVETNLHLLRRDDPLIVSYTIEGIRT